MTPSRKLYSTLTFVILLCVATVWVQWFLAARRTPLSFDDAYMFERYAHNIRAGLGMSWNLDGHHTYGPTSLLWAFCILVISYLPFGMWTQLVLASWLCAFAAVTAIAWAVARNAQSPLFRGSTFRVLPWVVVPLSLTLGGTAILAKHATTGMETMLATALLGGLCGLTLRWCRTEQVPSWTVGLLGFLTYLARPEAALVAMLLPALAFFLLPEKKQSLSRLIVALGTLFALILAELAVCRAYFGTVVPLSVYMKGKHAYLGYRGVWHPEFLLAVFLAAMAVYLGLLVLLSTRADRKLLVVFLLPALAVFAYLGTVTQIMGFEARYYMPYAALLIVPALLLLDARLVAREQQGTENLPSLLSVRSLTFVVLVVALLGLSTEAAQNKLRHLEHHHREEYDDADLAMAAAHPLPYVGWDTAMQQVTDLLVAPLPKGVSVAATEVGYLGAAAPNANVVDIAGLNDTEIALHGFDMQRFMKRKIDLIWMPNSDYTQQRGVMFADPAFLAQYDLYADAANYGLAIRKDSPFHAQIEAALARYWAVTYPGTRPEDFLVTHASWSGQHHMIYNE
ncbi:MAG: hypothetical protein PW792_16865 [Acidobacteriaceae bacterium]|nr:hypothetical protein [Acidobacteriaceae bacterium]